MGESNSAPPRGRLGRAASTVLAWLDQHPFPKLVGISWVVAVSVWTAWDGCQRSRLDAELAGLTYEPSTVFLLDGASCSLVNSGVRAVAEATLFWDAHVIDVGDCAAPMTLYTNRLRPAAEARELRPRETLTGQMPSERLESFCHDSRVADGTHRVIIEWHAQYYRVADLKPYTESRFGFVTDDCSDVVPVERTYSLQGDSIVWNDDRDRSTWLCFHRLRGTQRLGPEDLERVMERARQLLDRQRESVR